MTGFEEKKPTRVELNDDFIDRESERYYFKRSLSDVKTSGIGRGFLLIYSGIGRVGKTLLLKQFEKILVDKFYKNFIFVSYNFDSNEFAQADDMLVTLKTLRASLTKKYQVEFPLFEKGCIYLAQKSGEYVSAEQQRSVMKNSAMLRGFKSRLNSMKSKTDEAVTVTKILNNLFDSTGEFLSDMTNTSLVLKAGKYFVDFLDGVITVREEKARAEGDKSYGELLAELNKLNGEDAPAPIREILPRLFAKDLSFWLKAHDANLVIFLDAYEKLTGEEQGKKKSVRLISENRDVPVDWWIGKLLTAGRVMWVIAGRYEIKEIGEVDLKKGTVENRTVDVFDKNWSNKYLELQGIAEADLRTAIINLTGRHPYYLRKCAETYVNYKDQGKVPRPSDFGKNLDEIVEKTIGSLDESGQSMTQCLCILKNWTDEVAADVIGNFNKFTYNRVKKMVARAEQLSFGDDGYTFDKTIDAFLFQSLKRDVTCRKLFTDIRAAANVYFKKFFVENKINRRYDSDSKHNYYFKMWSEIILRTTDAPAELMTLYDENFEPLEKHFDYSTREVVVKKFFDKVGDNETLPSAYFQSRFASVRYWQNKDKEALELAEAAYSKVEKLSLSNDELPFKISVMHILADMFYRLSRHKDEIPLRKEIVRDCESCFPTKDKRIIEAKNFLARALEDGDKKDDAFKIRQEIFEVLDESDGENFIDAAKDFANALEDRGDYKSALPLRIKIVDFCEKTDDDGKIYWALSDIIDTLENLSGEKYLEEKAERYYQYMAVAKRRGDTLSSRELKKFSDTLKKLGRDEEAAKLLESQADETAHRVEDLERRIESFDAPNEESVELMEELVDLLEESNRDEEAERWKEKVTEAVRAVIKRHTAEPIENFGEAISALKNLSRVVWRAKIEIYRAILFLAENEKNPDAEESQVIEAKKDLVDKLELDEENYAEVGQLFADIENFYRKNLPASREEFVDALKEHAIFLENNLDNHSAAREKLIGALNVLVNDSESSSDEIFDVLDRIADIFDTEENYSKAVDWRERAWNFCKENLLEDDPTALRALDELIWACEKLEDRNKVEEYRQQLRAIKEKNLGSSHVDVISEKEELASTLHKAGKYDDELTLRRKVVELYRENFSANTANKYHSGYWFDFTLALDSLVKCLDRAGQESEALDVRRQIVDEWKDRIKVLKENSSDDYDIIDALDNVVHALNAVGDSDEELRYRLELVNFCKGKDLQSDDTLRALDGLADFYREHERTTDEMKTRKEIVGVRKAQLKELKKNSDDDEIIDALDNVVDALNAVGDSDEELRYRLELVNFCKEKDPQSDDTLNALESLADFYAEHDQKDAALKIYRDILENYSLEPEDVDDIQEKMDALTQGDELEEELEEEPTKETEEQPTEIDTSESLVLRKGQRVPLKKNNPALDKFTVDFHWEGDAYLEIDASAFLLDADGKTHADEDFIFYGNSEHQSGSVKYSSGDAQASMQIELKKIPDGVDKISFALTIYEAEVRKQNFSSVKVFARVIDEAARKEIFRFDLQEGFSVETAIVAGEIYRHKGEWKFNAVGAGFTGGLAVLCKNFGVEVN